MGKTTHLAAAGRRGGAAVRLPGAGRGLVLGHGVARSGGGGGAGMASAAIVCQWNMDQWIISLPVTYSLPRTKSERKERDRNVTINQENIGWDPPGQIAKQNIVLPESNKTKRLLYRCGRKHINT